MRLRFQSNYAGLSQPRKCHVLFEWLRAGKIELLTDLFALNLRSLVMMKVKSVMVAYRRKFSELAKYFQFLKHFIQAFMRALEMTVPLPPSTVARAPLLIILHSIEI